MDCMGRSCPRAALAPGLPSASPTAMGPGTMGHSPDLAPLQGSPLPGSTAGTAPNCPATGATNKACFPPQPDVASSAHVHLGCSHVPEPSEHPQSTARPRPQLQSTCQTSPHTLVSPSTAHAPHPGSSFCVGIACFCPCSLPRLSLSSAQLLLCSAACAEKAPCEK